MKAKADLLTTGEAARRLGLARTTVARWCRIGAIRCVRMPTGCRRIPADVVARILAGEDVGTWPDGKAPSGPADHAPAGMDPARDERSCPDGEACP